MRTVQEFIDSQLAKGRAYFSKATALAELGQTPQALQAALARLKKKGGIVSPRRGFLERDLIRCFRPTQV